MWKVVGIACAAASLWELASGDSSQANVNAGWHVPDDEYALCNVGSACQEDFRRANGTESKLWPDEKLKIRRDRVHSERNRLKLNRYQPPLVPTYTEIGYKKEKLPEATYEYLLDWYKSPARRPSVERWPPDNTYVNHWAVDTKMVNAPERIRERLYKDLLPLMEDWAGVKLKPTSCYGARIYYRDSVLANHVDRVDTHVVSAIINIAQANIDTDWPLFVRGHDGVDKNILIQPGEIIFYESASVLHGRPQAFQGDEFVNIFVHFAPVEGWTITADDVNKAARDDARRKDKEAKMAQASTEL